MCVSVCVCVLQSAALYLQLLALCTCGESCAICILAGLMFYVMIFAPGDVFLFAGINYICAVQHSLCEYTAGSDTVVHHLRFS